MIFIVLGHSAYHLATKTLVVGLVAFLCGLLGCLMSILALGIFWLAPTIRPQSPPHFKGKRPLSPLAQPRQLNALGVSFDPPPANLEDLQTSTDQEQPLPLGRSASFPDLHTADSHQTYRPASTRHVSFSPERNGLLMSNFPILSSFPSPTAPPAIQRRWSSAASTFNKLRATTDTARTFGPPLAKQCPHVQDLPLRCFDDQCKCHSRVHEFGLLVRCSSPEPLTTSPNTPSRRSSISSSMRLPQMRLSLSKKRRSSNVSYTPTLIELDEDNCRVASSKPPISVGPNSSLPLRPSSETHCALSINPLTNGSQSMPSTSRSLPKSRTAFSNPWIPASDASSPSSKPSLPAPCNDSQLPSRRKLANRFTSIFKASAGHSPHMAGSSSASRSIVKTMSSKFRRKPVARTQPYGPPWNAPMPCGPTFLEPDAPVPGRFYQTTDKQTFSSPKRTSKNPKHDGLSPEKTKQRPIQSGTLSPRTLVSALDERLSLLQMERSREPELLYMDVDEAV